MRVVMFDNNRLDGFMKVPPNDMMMDNVPMRIV